MENGQGAGAIGLIILAISVLMIVSMWRVFEKAGQPGWSSLIPFYNVYVMLKIAGKPGWWFFLLMVPLVNIVISFIVMFAFAKSFDKGAGFGIGLLFFGIIFLPILAFGDSEYVGGGAIAGAGQMA